MKIYLLSIIVFSSLLSCKKESPDLPPDEPVLVTVVTAPTVINDPVNFPPSASKVLTNAIQLNYGSIKVTKSMNLFLTHITPDIMGNYSVHIYLKSGNNYVHLPGITSLGNSYTYTLKAAFPFCNTTVTRSVGNSELFDDVIIVAAKNSYLLTMTPSLSFTDYNVVKVKLGL